MVNEKRLVSAEQAYEIARLNHHDFAQSIADLTSLREVLEDCDTVYAVELPKGKPGDYLLWDNGAGYRRPYRIDAIMICEDCARYCISICNPVVNHHGIVRIMSREEAERWVEDGK